MSELTSLIIIICFELTMIGKFISILWRVFFDNQLSMILYRLEKIREKMIRLNLVVPMKMNWFFIIGLIVHVIANIITPLLWVKIFVGKMEIKDMVIINN